VTDDSQLRKLQAVENSENPLGDWTAKPAVPATGVAVTNNSGSPMVVEVSVNGATMTNVKVDGVIVGSGTTPRTSGAFRVRPGSTIALTYSAGSPLWQWFYA